ncbi:MAG: hypothetical protein M4D80_24865 [Myxococcota bacterium]|nr:hypothetical protein [Myxococcota bacterium]
MRPVLLVCLLTGCDPLADSGYVGEPMFTLTGTFVAPGKTPDVGGLALMWQDSGGAGGPGIVMTTVPVEVEFPSTFRVSVPLPPPAIVRFAFDDGVELAEAYVFVVDDPDAARPTPHGLDRAHALVYASEDVAAGTQAADYLGGPVSAGYHLRRYTTAEPGAAQRTMIDRCVASGAVKTACGARRAYQLAEAADNEPLRIVVTP